MPGTFQIIEKIMLDRMFSAPAPLSGLENIKQFLCALSAFFLLVALIFLVYGAHTWLSLHYSRDTAIIMTGTLCFAISITIAIILFGIISYHKFRIRKVHQKIQDKIKSTLSTLESELGDPIRENPKTALVIATFLGFLAEDQFFE